MRIHRFTRRLAGVAAAAAVAAVAVLAAPSPAHADPVYYTLYNYGSHLDAYARYPNSGSTVYQHPVDGLTDDQWEKIPVRGIANTYQLQNHWSGFCLDVNWSLQAGAPVTHRPCVGGLTQYWIFTSVGSDVNGDIYQVLNAFNGYALSAESSQTNARLVQTRWILLSTQKWQTIEV